MSSNSKQKDAKENTAILNVSSDFINSINEELEQMSFRNDRLKSLTDVAENYLILGELENSEHLLENFIRLINEQVEIQSEAFVNILDKYGSLSYNLQKDEMVSELRKHLVANKPKIELSAN